MLVYLLVLSLHSMKKSFLILSILPLNIVGTFWLLWKVKFNVIDMFFTEVSVKFTTKCKARLKDIDYFKCKPRLKDVGYFLVVGVKSDKVSRQHQLYMVCH